jgi:hypothetical protein
LVPSYATCVSGMVQSVIRRLPNSLCPVGRIHGKTCGCKWSLLKLKEIQKGA